MDEMPRAARALLGLLMVIMLVAAACGGETPDAGDATDAPDAGEDADLPDGAVAVVDGNEITEETFEDRYDQVLAIPSVAEQIEGQREAAEPTLRAQVLSQLLVSDILLRGAEDDFGIEVTDEDVRDRLEELEEEAGGEDEFAAELEETGLTKEVLVDQQLPLEIMIEQVEDELGDDDVETPPPPAEPGQQQQPTEAQLALQEWAVGKFSEADVVVSSEIGTWDPQSGQVRPPGGAGVAPPGQQAPPG